MCLCIWQASIYASHKNFMNGYGCWDYDADNEGLSNRHCYKTFDSKPLN